MFDAAAKSNDVSLNYNLRTGPDLLNSLMSILLRFRKFPFAIVGDIESMFNQVRLTKEDREATRFLWNDNPACPTEHYQMLVHIQGAANSPCCSCYALNRAAIDQKDMFSDLAVQTVLRISIWMT